MGLSTGAIVGVVAALVVALVVAIVLVLLYTKSRFPEPEAETAPADAEAANAGANQKKLSHEPYAPEALKAPPGITPPRPHSSKDPFGGGASFNTAPSFSDGFTPTAGHGTQAPPPTPDVVHQQQMHRYSDVGRDVEVQSEESWDEVTEVPPLQNSRSTSFKSSASAVRNPYAEEDSYTVWALMGALMFLSSEATLEEEIRMLEEEQCYQEEIDGDRAYKEKVQQRLAVRQEMKTLKIDIPITRQELEEMKVSLKKELSGQGQEQVQRDLDNATAALEKVTRERQACQKDIDTCQRRLREIPEENAAVQSALEECQGAIRVIARVRPGRADEGSGGEENCIDVENNTTVSVLGTSEKYTYDVAFWTEVNQADVFSEVRSHVEDLFRGKNAVIFAYGQTGSGKTHTLVGSEQMPGVSMRMIDEVYRYRREKYGALFAHRWPITCSMQELYIDDFFDLLQKGKPKLPKTGGTRLDAATQMPAEKEARNKKLAQALLRCVEEGLRAVAWATLHKYGKQRQMQKQREGKKTATALLEDDEFAGSYRPGQGGLLRAAMRGTFKMKALVNKEKVLWQPLEVQADTEQELRGLMDKGILNRTVRGTAMNATSSRSHLIFTIIVRSPEGHEGRMALIDLAGSERLARSQKDDDKQEERKKEAIAINTSLSSLGNVIAALSQIDARTGAKKVPIPYREHSLTMMLQPWLTGSSKVTMFMNVSPLVANKNETHSTLRFAQRAKAAKLQDDAKAIPLKRQIRELQKEEKKVQEQLYVHKEKLESELNYRVEEAEQKRQTCQDLVENAAKRRQLLEDKIDELQAKERKCRQRYEKLTKATKRPRRYICYDNVPRRALIARVEKGNDAELARGATGRLWDHKASMRLMKRERRNSKEGAWDSFDNADDALSFRRGTSVVSM